MFVFDNPKLQARLQSLVDWGIYDEAYGELMALLHEAEKQGIDHAVKMMLD